MSTVVAPQLIIPTTNPTTSIENQNLRMSSESSEDLIKRQFNSGAGAFRKNSDSTMASSRTKRISKKEKYGLEKHFELNHASKPFQSSFWLLSKAKRNKRCKRIKSLMRDRKVALTVERQQLLGYFPYVSTWTLKKLRQRSNLASNQADQLALRLEQILDSIESTLSKSLLKNSNRIF